jgi:hypothetical protein
MRSVRVTECCSPVGKTVHAGPGQAPSMSASFAIAARWSAISVSAPGGRWASAGGGDEQQDGDGAQLPGVVRHGRSPVHGFRIMSTNAPIGSSSATAPHSSHRCANAS